MKPGVASSITVLTVNMHKGFALFKRRLILHELREAVRQVSADIVFLQEVLGTEQPHHRHLSTWQGGPQYEFLADEIWPDFAYGRNAVYPRGHHGNALLSKFPIAGSTNYDVSINRKEKRGLLHCVLTVPGYSTPIHTVCAHLGLLGTHRRQQVELLCRLIETEVPPTTPLIVAGDFNDWRLQGHTLLSRCAGLREAFTEMTGQPAKTFPARWPLLPLDRIYVRDVHLRQSHVLATWPWSHLSDHAALMARIEL